MILLRNFQTPLTGTVYPEAILTLRPRLPLHVPGVSKASEVKMRLTLSMSRKATYWDNAPMEFFFSHLKDEVNYS
ncbi:hypothetical protein NDK43_24805 [Neobacillus pocheonensis]|uniref:Transposase n=1 Tax=Neobacillus pocheonensis TaxID=363869 RepID=A0ABT0WIR5_9BACI|nr:hypothetical protein [Neobacillus pocheonensis]